MRHPVLSFATRGLGLAILLAFVLAACGGGGSDDVAAANLTPTPEAGPNITTEPAHVVTSSDGVIEFDVPAGAIPAGTEITIEPTEAPDGADVAYEFGPDGLEFDEPATLTWRLDGQPEQSTAYLLAALSSDGSVEVVDGVTVSLENDQTVVSAPVVHFSSYALRELEIELKQVEPVGSVPVETMFRFVVEIAGIEGLDPAVPTFESMVSLTPRSGGQRLPGETNQGGIVELGANYLEYVCKPMGRFLVRVHGGVSLMWDIAGGEQEYAGASTIILLQTECTTTPTGTALSIGVPPYDDAVPLDGEIIVGLDGGVVTVTVPSEVIPTGGVYGLTFLDAEETTFVQCNFDRRESSSSACSAFDRTGVSKGTVELTETENDDGTVSLDIPAEVFEIGPDGLVMVLGESRTSIALIDVSAFKNENAWWGSLDLDEFIEALTP